MENSKIAKICASLSGLFAKFKKPANKIPSELIAIGGQLRSGLSTNESITNIITSLTDRGFPIEKNDDGTPNMTNIFVGAIVEEIFRALHEDANIQIGVMPGALTSIGVGANGGGPVVVTSTNINSGVGSAVIL